MANITKTEEAVQEIMQLGKHGSGLDVTYDQLRLFGAVVGLTTLLQIALYSADDKARQQAAKELSRLQEDPQKVVDRLREAAFRDLDMDQIRDVVDELSAGRTDLQNIIREVKDEEEGY